jgi:hypothetical protein
MLVENSGHWGIYGAVAVTGLMIYSVRTAIPYSSGKTKTMKKVTIMKTGILLMEHPIMEPPAFYAI